jgi:hypothetical protein
VCVVWLLLVGCWFCVVVFQQMFHAVVCVTFKILKL